MSRIHIIFDNAEKERFRQRAAGEGMSHWDEHRKVIEGSVRSGLAES